MKVIEIRLAEGVRGGRKQRLEKEWKRRKGRRKWRERKEEDKHYWKEKYWEKGKEYWKRRKGEIERREKRGGDGEGRERKNGRGGVVLDKGRLVTLRKGEDGKQVGRKWRKNWKG